MLSHVIKYRIYFWFQEFLIVANLFYRNTNAKIYVEVLDNENNYVGVSTSSIKWYIKTPDNYIYSNDSNIGSHDFVNGVGIYTATPSVQQEATGIYYIQYVVTKVGEYKYKFQITDNSASVKIAISGDIKVIGDGIF